MLGIIDKRIKYLGIKKHIVSHSFRAFCANMLLSEGVDNLLIKKYMGWRIKDNDMLGNIYYRSEIQEKQFIEYSQILWK